VAEDVMKLLIRFVSLIVCVALTTMGPRASSAQDVTGERVRFALERTDQRIELAQSLVAGASNTQAQLEVEAALNIQGQARQVFDQAQAAVGDLQLRLLRQAQDLTFRARARADRAISLIQGLPDPERVLAQVDRTHELIERARDRIEECDNDRARALLRVAVEMQQRAETAAHESRYLAALQLTLSARERALRALRLCNLGDNLREACERAIHRTDEVIARARDNLAERAPERARTLLSRAERVQGEASSQFHAEHFEASIRLTQSARGMAQRAIRIAGEGR
jgi:uncharacterized protein YmfQ (DUF2313 family)